MNLLKAYGADLHTAEDNQELAPLESRYGDVPLDLTLAERHKILAKEAIKRLRQHPSG
jgi:hypothetical protein